MTIGIRFTTLVNCHPYKIIHTYDWYNKLFPKQLIQCFIKCFTYCYTQLYGRIIITLFNRIDRLSGNSNFFSQIPLRHIFCSTGGLEFQILHSLSSPSSSSSPSPDLFFICLINIEIPTIININPAI